MVKGDFRGKAFGAAGLFLSLLLSPPMSLVAAKAQKETPSVPTTVTQKAQALLNQTIRALGGQAYLEWKTLTTKGHVYVLEEGQTSGFAPYRSTVELPDKRRFSYGSGHPVTLINNGDQGWEIDQYGIIHQKPSDIERWKTANRYSLDNILRYLVHEKGILAEDAGTDFVENQPAHVLEILDSRQAKIKLYLDRDTGLPKQVTYHLVDPKTHEPKEYTDVYSDYRQVQGIQTPMHETRFQDGERMAEVFRTSAQYDAPHPADFFEPGQ